MSWYHSSWHFREAVTVHNSGSGTTLDIQFTVPKDLQRFWTNVATNAHDVRVTASDGTTALTFNRSSFTHATNTLVVDVDNYVLPGGNAAINGKSSVIWLYWGFDDAANGAASDVADSNVSLSSAVTTTSIALGLLSRSGCPIIACKAEAPTATTPTPVIALKPNETIHVWWDFRRWLSSRRTRTNGSLLLEEIDLCFAEAEGSDQVDLTSTLLVQSETLVMHPGFVRTTIKAIASAASNYMVTLTVTTTAGRTLAFPALVKQRTFTAPSP